MMQLEKRGPDKIREHFNMRAAYKYLRKNHSEIKIEADEFNKIVHEGNTAIINKIIYNNLKFLVPGRLGYIEIRKKKVSPKLDKDGKLDVKSLPADFGSTIKLWKEDEEAHKQRRLVYHLNEHTEGYILKFKWDKASALVKNKSVYTFTPCRAAARAVAKAIKETPEIDFYEY
jgi:hypothetical protein